ncbi:hypothetical protein HID58_042547 [Brassica napus]|uniref:BnaC01g42590D protein n=2 Tax=Brassica napus TaxID=3708 RepID=A0A078IYY4_BRANA|nr:hypothetical protein HID58_042547 [Brassica napus]CAF2074036.1 unnamed protein product [Brassica napus]CDY55602.1 BnaC01g42590D [Brassica napus]
MHQYRRLRTKNLSVPLNQSDLNEKERGEGEPGEGSSHGGIETAMVLRTVVETSEGGETGQLTDLVNPSTIDKSVDPETDKAHAKEIKDTVSKDSEAPIQYRNMKRTCMKR